MKKTLIITGIVVMVSTIALVIFLRVTSGKTDAEQNLAPVRQGSFEIVVNSMGELVPEHSIDINGPNIVRNRNFRSGLIRILDIVPEGTLVKQGEYIASLDKTEFDNNLKTELTTLRTKESELETKVLDTAVVLSTLRDEIRDQEFIMMEAEIVVAQSKYEPPATQRQVEIEYDKAKRTLEAKQKLYNFKRAQALMETKILKNALQSQKTKVEDIENILEDFTIKAPAAGMVIYKKDRTGVKRKAGSSIDPFDPVVATLPDLSSMISKTFVSEIEVSHLQKGQPVDIKVDAFPERSYTGEVISIANIGEVLPNSDSKQFEVLVRVYEYDPLLRPSMTTGNRVIVKSYDNVIYVPIESVQAGSDNIPFVYTKDGLRQIVIPGEANDKNIIIEEGLTKGKFVFLSPPEKAAKFKQSGDELIGTIREREIAYGLVSNNFILK